MAVTKIKPIQGTVDKAIAYITLRKLMIRFLYHRSAVQLRIVLPMNLNGQEILPSNVEQYLQK